MFMIFQNVHKQYTIKHFLMVMNLMQVDIWIDFLILKITLSPADKKKFYNKLELNKDDFFKNYDSNLLIINNMVN